MSGIHVDRRWFDGPTPAYGKPLPSRVSSNAPIVRPCDVCAADPAVVDAPTVFGPWAYMCAVCYERRASNDACVVGVLLWEVPK